MINDTSTELLAYIRGYVPVNGVPTRSYVLSLFCFCECRLRSLGRPSRRIVAAYSATKTFCLTSRHLPNIAGSRMRPRTDRMGRRAGSGTAMRPRCALQGILCLNASRGSPAHNSICNTLHDYHDCVCRYFIDISESKFNLVGDIRIV